MTVAELLAVAMALSRDRLSPELARYLLPDRVWALSVLLVAWASGKPGVLPPELRQRATLPGLLGFALDSLQGELIPLLTYAAKPSTDPLAVRLAGLSVLAAGLIGRLGANTLQTLVTNPQFTEASQAVIRAYPIPAVVTEAFSGTAPTESGPLGRSTPAKDRIRDFDRFDYKKPNPDNDPAYIRRQLDDPMLAPEMRMYLEERLAFMGLAKYRDDAEAKTVWETVLRGPMQSEVRGYFIDALNALEGKTSEEV